MSSYVLPYPVGRSFVVGQGNCTDGSHETGTDQAYAYDFDMPIGESIVASRAGTVLAVEESFADDSNISGQENFVLIRHSDETVTGYFHLTQNGGLVEEGTHVSQGEPIAQSGNSGLSSEPHLHFEVLTSRDGNSIPVTFRNTRAHPNGLVEGQSYEAESY